MNSDKFFISIVIIVDAGKVKSWNNYFLEINYLLSIELPCIFEEVVNCIHRKEINHFEDSP